MPPARAGFCPLLLLLLLGLWVAQVSTKSKHSLAQWFETQSVQPSPQGCKGVMGNINKHTHHCRGLHTFLHEAFQCGRHLPEPHQEGCHQSQKPRSLTTCELPLGRYQDHRYKDKQLDDTLHHGP
ncbi:ribonuclease 7-like [Pipistrellus kuhlii]|uniref:ribonuclease 7-like n=1 Tax=Pipistrellus kuhlii TaxID=59472 RepID=UPI001E273847|nr:ribonuclease 7-like [Pipistrellus kuhlii]